MLSALRIQNDFSQTTVPGWLPCDYLETLYNVCSMDLISHRKSDYFIDVGIWQPCVEPRIISFMQQCRQCWSAVMVRSQNGGELRILDHLRVYVSRKTQGRKEALVFGLNKSNRKSILILFLYLEIWHREKMFCWIFYWIHQFRCKNKFIFSDDMGEVHLRQFKLTN